MALLFVSYPGTTKTRSVKELKGFARVSLEANQTKRITIPLRVSDLTYYDSTSKGMVVDSGSVQVQVGTELGGPPAQRYLHGELNLVPILSEKIDTIMNSRSAWSLVWAAVAVPSAIFPSSAFAAAGDVAPS